MSIFHDAYQKKDIKKFVSRIYKSIQAPKTILHSPLNKNGRRSQKHKYQKRPGWKYVRHKQPLQTQNH